MRIPRSVGLGVCVNMIAGGVLGAAAVPAWGEAAFCPWPCLRPIGIWVLALLCLAIVPILIIGILDRHGKPRRRYSVSVVFGLSYTLSLTVSWTVAWVLGRGTFFGPQMLILWSFAGILIGPCALAFNTLLINPWLKGRVGDEYGPVCECCGYSLNGLLLPRCPECGRPFDGSLLQEQEKNRQENVSGWNGMKLSRRRS